MRHRFTNAEITGAWLDGLHNASTHGSNKRPSQRFSGNCFYSYNLLIAARITEHRFLLCGARSSATTNAHIRRLERELMGRYDAEDFRGFVKHTREQNNEQN